jgi:hypothetical protein
VGVAAKSQRILDISARLSDGNIEMAAVCRAKLIKDVSDWRNIDFQHTCNV